MFECFAFGLGNFLCTVRVCGCIIVGFSDLRLIDLEAPDPDLAVREREAHDVVNERFGFPCAFGDAEDMGEELFDDEEVGLGGKGGIEGENRA